MYRHIRRYFAPEFALGDFDLHTQLLQAAVIATMSQLFSTGAWTAFAQSCLAPTGILTANGRDDEIVGRHQKDENHPGLLALPSKSTYEGVRAYVIRGQESAAFPLSVEGLLSPPKDAGFPQ